MSRLPITVACGPYDRTRALATGRVEVEGAEVRYVTLEPEEVFHRMARHREFEVAELSLSTFLITLSRGAPFVAIPVFPSRMFRHSGIYVHSGSGIDEPAGLRGARVGVAEYQLTANVWLRGILEEHHGVPVTSVRYRTGGLNQAGREEKTAVDLPADLDLAPIPAGSTLSDLLAAGEIDALYSPRAPDSFLAGHPGVRRLFADPRAQEVAYYRRSGIFPIMHVVVIRRDVYQANRWLARSLTKAFTEAKTLALAEMARTAALSVTLPWLLAELQATTELLGQDFWPYGLPRNERVLDVFARYSHAQGLAERRYRPEELFAPESLDDVIV